MYILWSKSEAKIFFFFLILRSANYCLIIAGDQLAWYPVTSSYDTCSLSRTWAWLMVTGHRHMWLQTATEVLRFRSAQSCMSWPWQAISWWGSGGVVWPSWKLRKTSLSIRKLFEPLLTFPLAKSRGWAQHQGHMSVFCLTGKRGLCGEGRESEPRYLCGDYTAVWIASTVKFCTFA